MFIDCSLVSPFSGKAKQIRRLIVMNQRSWSWHSVILGIGVVFLQIHSEGETSEGLHWSTAFLCLRFHRNDDKSWHRHREKSDAKNTRATSFDTFSRRALCHRIHRNPTSTTAWVSSMHFATRTIRNEFLHPLRLHSRRFATKHFAPRQQPGATHHPSF